MDKVGCIILHGWDVSSAISFDNLRRNEKINIKLSQEAMDKLYFLSGFNPYDEINVIWSLYLYKKRPITIEDLNQIVGHLVVHRLADTCSRTS